MSAMPVDVQTLQSQTQKLLAISVRKIMASRAQKGGIRLHKNLLVASVLHKGRTLLTALQKQMSEQIAVQPLATTNTTTTPPTDEGVCVEMTEENRISPDSSVTPTLTALSGAPQAGAVPAAETGSRLSVEVTGYRDQENTTPPSPLRTTPSPSPSPSVSPDCEDRLFLQRDGLEKVGDAGAVISSPTVSTDDRTSPLTHKVSSTCKDFFTQRARGALKRRRVLDSNHEPVPAPKIRVLECAEVKKQPVVHGNAILIPTSVIISARVPGVNTDGKNVLCQVLVPVTAPVVWTAGDMIRHRPISVNDNVSCAQEWTMGGVAVPQTHVLTA